MAIICVYCNKRGLGEITSAFCRGHDRCWEDWTCSPSVVALCKEGCYSAVDNVDAMVLHGDHAPNTLSEKPVGECASFPLAIGSVESETVRRVRSSFPPPTAYSQLFRLCRGDEGSKSVTGLRQWRNGAILKPKCFN